MDVKTFEEYEALKKALGAKIQSEGHKFYRRFWKENIMEAGISTSYDRFMNGLNGFGGELSDEILKIIKEYIDSPSVEVAEAEQKF